MNTGPSGQEDLIDEALARGACRGYVVAINTACESVWTATANPTRPGWTADRYFGLNMDGLIFFSPKSPLAFSADGSPTNAIVMSH